MRLKGVSRRLFTRIIRRQLRLIQREIPIRTPDRPPHLASGRPRQGHTRGLSPRLTDWSLALGGGLAFLTGLLSLFSGQVEQWTIFTLHGMAGLWLLVLLWGKLRRVWPRMVQPRRWDRRTVFGLLAVLMVALASGSGIWWVAGGDLFFGGFNLLNWHVMLGVALTALIGSHMLARAKRLRARDVRGRRQALRFGALALSAMIVWPAQQAVQRVLALPGARRRFTGSREISSFAGNAFPTSSWVADAPRRLESAGWRLSVSGAVVTPLTLSYAELIALASGVDAIQFDELEALLDCTGGFYSTQRWRGIRVKRLLDLVNPLPDARYVSFVAVTSYRWSLPLEEAREALLATHLGEEALSHEHGAPARLVAPGRRGFQWVKWITHVEVLTEPDWGQLLAIETSSFTPEGRGEQ